MPKLLPIFIYIALVLPAFSARTVKTIFLKPPAGAPEQAFLWNETTSVEVSLPRRNLSAPVKLPKGTSEFLVLSQLPANEDTLPAGAQKIMIPDAWSDTILIFIPSKSNKKFPARVIVVNASNDAFKKGETMVYNLTTSIFIGKLGGETVRVKARGTGVVKAPLATAGFYPVAIDCFIPKTKERKAVIRSNWKHNDKARQLLFVLPNPGKDVPRIWGVLDRFDKLVEKEE